MTVWAQLAAQLEARAGGLRRFVAEQADPLVLTQLDGEERLEEGEDDFSLSDGFRVYRETNGIPVGAVILVHETPDEFVAVDVQTDRAVSGGGGGGTLVAVDPGAPTADLAPGYYLDSSTGELYHGA